MNKGMIKLFICFIIGAIALYYTGFRSTSYALKNGLMTEKVKYNINPNR